MRHSLMLAATALTAMIPGAYATANAVTITFEDLAEGAVLSNQYAAQGVTFVANAFTGPGSSSSGSVWATNTGMRVTATDLGGLGTPSLVSGKILHAYGNTYLDGDWLDENGDPSFSMNFSTAISSISLAFAGVATPADTRIFVYNGATLLATVAGTVTTGQFILSYSAASITRVAVAPGSFNDWVGVDNINFTPIAAGAVPEPATWAMLVGGFGLVGASMRRRRRTGVAQIA